MSQAGVQAFVERATNDVTFRSRLRAAGDHGFLGMAKEAGYDVTSADFADVTLLDQLFTWTDPG